MRILQINSWDVGGGAERMITEFSKSFTDRGMINWIAVGRKYSLDDNIIEIPRLPPSSNRIAKSAWTLRDNLEQWEGRRKGVYRIRSILRILGGLKAEIERRKGFEDFNFPGTWHILDSIPQKPDIIHLHNLHGEFFDLSYLKFITKEIPVFMTLHDQWMTTGHCAVALNCERWKMGCGNCPDLNLYPAVQKDATDFNWQRKKEIYSESNIYLATPSVWLMKLVEQSMLMVAIKEARVINNGVNLGIYKPGDSRKIRNELKLPVEAKILLSVANRIRKNQYKDFNTLWNTIQILARDYQINDLVVVILGEEAPNEHIGSTKVIYVPYIQDSSFVARYYQAADVFIYPTRADNFPTAIIEALACGVPVVATNIGGIPEQIRENETGYLIPLNDPISFSKKIMYLLNNDEIRRNFGRRAVEEARLRFDVNNKVDAYLEWYQEVINN